MKALNSREIAVLRNALTEYALMLRTDVEGRLLDEGVFLRMPYISEGQKANYLTALGLRAEVEANNLLLRY